MGQCKPHASMREGCVRMIALAAPRAGAGHGARAARPRGCVDAPCFAAPAFFHSVHGHFGGQEGREKGPTVHPRRSEHTERHRHAVVFRLPCHKVTATQRPHPSRRRSAAWPANWRRPRRSRPSPQASCTVAKHRARTPRHLLAGLVDHHCRVYRPRPMEDRPQWQRGQHMAALRLTPAGCKTRTAQCSRRVGGGIDTHMPVTLRDGPSSATRPVSSPPCLPS